MYVAEMFPGTLFWGFVILGLEHISEASAVLTVGSVDVFKS